MTLGITNGSGDPYKASIHEWIQTDTAGGVIHIDLPAITAANVGAEVGVINMSTGSTNTVRVNTTGSDTVDEASSFFDLLSDLQTGIVVSDGVGNWMRYFAI